MSAISELGGILDRHMSKFSSKFGFDKKTSQEIVEDAPEWTRIAFIDGILTDLLYIDLDSRYGNPENRPLGIKMLHRDFGLSCRIQLQPEDYDSWFCQERFFQFIKSCQWYYFYDLVELTCRKLKESEGEYAFEVDKLNKFGFASFKKKVNDLFREDNIVWQLNDEGELIKTVPEVLQRLLDQTQGKLIDNLDPARLHYKKAFRYIFSFPTDTENGIKEIVSAVESAGRTIYPNASTLGDVIKQLKKDSAVPDMLIPVMEKYYAFANASPAVRHGSNQHSNLLTTDGEFVFYVGVAMIRYLLKVHQDKNAT